MENYRELTERCFEMFDTVPGLQELFDGVRRDPDLRWEVRLGKRCSRKGVYNKGLTCYYKSGKLFGMEFHPNSESLAFEFDHKYFYLDDAHRPLFARLEEWNAGKPHDPRQWLERLDQLKAVINEWKVEKKANREADSQQALTRNITFAKGDCQYIDTEFAVPGYRQVFGQMDMVAVRREGERYIPVLVELKHDKKEFYGEHGVLAHYNKAIRLLSAPGGEARLVESIRRTWKTKVRLGLLDCPVPAPETFGEAEMMVAVTGWRDGSADTIRELLPDKLERTVRVAISGTEELYFDGSMPLRAVEPWASAPTLNIHRGADRIGGGCTEISTGRERILIDFGASLPGTDEDGAVKDSEMAATVFDGRPAKAVLFTHYHGDHYGLYKEVPSKVPMYIGPLAKQILQVLVPRLDRRAEVKGAPIVKRMKTYRAGHWMDLSPNFSVLPLYVDHSALDAYMLYIRAGGKKILFTGDFRTHGIQSERDQLWSALKQYVVPGGVDVLVTEGTMLSRLEETKENPVQTERDLGRAALKKFREHKYNFVMLSSTNLDSIMMFYHYTPKGMLFVCDSYQAEVMLTAMKGMEVKEPRWYQRSPYQPTVYIWRTSRDEDLSELERMGAALAQPIQIVPADGGLMSQRGFVFLTRRNSFAHGHKAALDSFYPLDGSRDAQLIYSMWKGYLCGSHRDKDLLWALGARKPVPLHTSGHAYIDAIAQLIELTDPKVIVPMHTECAQEFKDFPEFARWKDRVQPLTKGQRLPLDSL